MNIDTSRKVDYYVGIPLCFFGTLVARLMGLAGNRRPLPGLGNVLLIELSEMGSAILADPAMQKLKRELDANLHFVIFQRNRQSLELLKTVPPENVFEMDDSTLFSLASDTVRFLAWARRKKIDTVIDLELFSRFTALLAGFSGAARRVGFHGFHSEGLYRGNFLTHRVAYNPHHHVAKNFIALVNALLSDRPEIPYSKTRITDDEVTLRRITVDEGARTDMKRKILNVYPSYSEDFHRLVIFNFNDSDVLPLRRWPRENYIRLASMVLERWPDIIILLTGTRAEQADKETFAKAVGSDRCISFAGMTTVSELPALYSISEFMLTNDSGPAHFSSVTDMPSYVFFGPETPSLYGPLSNFTPIYAGLACSPCLSAANHRKSVCTNNICLQTITTEEILEILRPKLEESA